MSYFACRLTKFNWLSKPFRGFLLWQAAKPSPDKKPNYFFIPPKFAFSLKLNLLVFPRLAFYLRSFCVNSPKSVFRYSLFLYICRNIYMSMKRMLLILSLLSCLSTVTFSQRQRYIIRRVLRIPSETRQLSSEATIQTQVSGVGRLFTLS